MAEEKKDQRNVDLFSNRELIAQPLINVDDLLAFSGF